MNQTTSHCKIYLEIADVNFRLNNFSLNAILAFIHLALSGSQDNATDMELVALRCWVVQGTVCIGSRM